MTGGLRYAERHIPTFDSAPPLTINRQPTSDIISRIRIMAVAVSRRSSFTSVTFFGSESPKDFTPPLLFVFITDCS